MKKKRKSTKALYKVFCYSKIFLIMRITMFLLLFSVIQVMGESSYSQSTRLSLNLKDVSIENVLDEIENQSEFFFLFNQKLVNVDRKVDIEVKNKRIKDVLADLFTGEDVNCLVMDRQILLSPKYITERVNVTRDRQPQGIVVTGKVTDEDGNTLPGVNIIIKGTTTGTISNADGNYSLEVDDPDAVLVFSFVGYSDQEIAVAGQTILDVSMQVDILGLDEIVVIGYGTQKKVNLTGAVDFVTSDELANRSVGTVAQTIQGIVPNLGISIDNYEGGEPGATQHWNLRGEGTLTGSEAPYILVDGVPMDIAHVNPEDIESVSILKDAAASAIYGARAPFGVILITTKRGTKGDLKINYSNNFGFGTPTLLPKAANSLDAALAMNYAAANDGSAALYTDATLGRIRAYQAGTFKDETVISASDPNRWATWFDANANNDFMDIYYKDWVGRQKHNLSLSGGSDKTNYYVSVGFYDQPGQLNYGDEYYKRYNLTANLSSDITDWFTFNFRTKYARSEKQVPNAYGGYDRNVIWHGMTRAWPSNAWYFPDGQISASTMHDLLEQNGKELNKTDDFWMTLGGIIEPITGWKTEIVYNFNNNSYKQTRLYKTTYGKRVDGSLYPINNSVNQYNAWFSNNDYRMLRVMTSYERYIGDHFVYALLGYEQELDENAGLSGYKKALVNQDVPSISTATGDSQINDWWEHWATQGVFMRLNYNFQEKYLFEFNARRDGSSKFEGADAQLGFFPSASVGYNISKEPFWDPIKAIVNSFKIRGSWGSLGNHGGEDVPNYSYIPILPVYTNLSWIMGSQRPVYTRAPGIISPSLTWETSTTIDIGVDAALLNNRLGVTFDWYNRTTTDMFGPAQALPSVLGTSPPQENNAELETKGFELIISWKDRISSDLSYNLKFALGDNKSTVTKYNNPTGILESGDPDNPVWHEGQVLGDIWGYETVGFFQDAADVDAHADQSVFHALWTPGDIKYNDRDGDGEITYGANTLDDHGDKLIIGNNRARYNFGITAGARYKGFDFRMFWQGVMKRDIMFSNSTNVFWGFRGSMWQNSYYDEHMDYWSPAGSDFGGGPDAYYPKPYILGEHRKNTQPQTKYVVDGSYIRLKNIEIGYTLPQELTQKVAIQKARIFIGGENVLVFTKLTKLFDPEITGGGLGGGKMYPIQKVYSAGINLSF